MILCCVIHTSSKSFSMWKSVIFPKKLHQSNPDRVLLQICSLFGGPSLVVFPRLAVIRTAGPVCLHLQRLDGADERQKCSTSTWTAQTLWGSKENCAFTCLWKSRWSSLGLGLLGDWRKSGTGERDRSALKTFSSSKHPVSIICRRGEEEVQVPFGRQRKRLWKYLVLPRDGNAACVEFGVEIFVRLVQTDSPQCGKLVDVQHIAAVHVPGLHKENNLNEAWG